MRAVEDKNTGVSLPRICQEHGFDPISLAASVERGVTENKSRLYTCFSLSPNFGGSVKAYAVGCNLRCKFCWSPCRSHQEVDAFCTNSEKIEQLCRPALVRSCAEVGLELDTLLNLRATLDEIEPSFFSAAEVVDRMVMAAEAAVTEGIGSFELCTEGNRPETIKYFTISGGEPTIARPHLLEVLADFADRGLSHRFLLQTNGFLFGADPSYLSDLVAFKDFIKLRISLKAGTAQGLLERTGAMEEAFPLPFRAIDQALALGFTCHLAVMSDPTVMPRVERDALFAQLSAICTVYGRQLETMDVYYKQAAAKRQAHGAVLPVLIDEEKYVPVFPEILGIALDSEHEMGLSC